MDPYKDIIPEFVFKLHHILQKNQYKEFITWTNQGTQILIKNAKKLQDKVLPYLFRHKNLSSFIRQLNMYRFNKVNKIQKERGHMYFKNDHFRRGQFQEMKLIKRSHRRKKGQIQNLSAELDDQNIKQPSINQDLASYKIQSHSKFAEVEQIIIRMLKKHPQLQSQLSPALQICQNMKGDHVLMTYMDENSLQILFPEAEIDQEQINKNMLGITVRDLPPVMVYPSICSLTLLDP